MLFKEYKSYSKDFESDIKSNIRIYDRYRDAVRRCNNKSCKDYLYYGARGIKVDITKDQWKLFFKKEIFKILRKGYYSCIDEVLDSHEIDRIKSTDGYRKGNIRLIDSFCNWYYTNQPSKYLTLTYGLDVPLYVFSILLEKKSKFFSYRVTRNAYISLGTMLLDLKSRKPMLPFLYYDIRKPPFLLNKIDGTTYNFDCRCGKTHTIDFSQKYEIKYECGLIINLSPTKNYIADKIRRKIIEPEEFKKSLQYVQKVMGIYRV